VIASTAVRAVHDSPRTTFTLHLTVRGSGRSLHARCVTPTVHDLRHARTARQAQRIVTRAGFGKARITRKRIRVVPRGHWYVDGTIGNRAPLPCGGRLRLVKSLGWS